jgi:hypothetical protein
LSALALRHSKISQVHLSDAGAYRVLVSNVVGQDSSVGQLIVLGPAFAKRTLPGDYVPGTKLVVTLAAKPLLATLAYTIEDSVPAGWLVGAISAGGTFDSVNGLVKFGPFFDNVARTVTYEVTAPTGSASSVQFVGYAVADGVPSLISGDSTLELLSLHPADDNPPDERISAIEVTAYGEAWKRGDAWPQGPNPIPPSYVSRAGAIWRGGEYYKVDLSVTSGPPLWWVNRTTSGSGKIVPKDTNSGAGDSQKSGEEFSAWMPAQYVPGLPIRVKTEVTPPPGTLMAIRCEAGSGWRGEGRI